MTAALPALDAATGLVLLLAGLVAWRGRPVSLVGLLLLVSAVCWFAGSVVGALAFVHRGPLVQLHVSYPTGRVHRRRALAVVALAWVAALLEGLTPLPWLTLTLSVLVAAAALDIYARSSGNARKAGGPALASALLFAGMLGIGAVNTLMDLRLDASVAVAYDLVVVLVAGWLTIDLLAGRWTEATVADLVSQLGGQDDTRGVRAALRQALGDPDLTLGYRVPGEDAYVDDDGLPVDVRPAGDQVATVVEDERVPVAVLVHAASVLEDPELARAAVAAVRLAVGNVALRAQVAAQTRELTRARRGLVESADRQRVAVTRALEEGAEQRLARVAALVDGLGADGLRGELEEARRDLRALAAGVRPRELEAAGLAGAVTALAVRSAAPTTLDLRIGRVPPAVESALYFVCAEALTNVAKHSGARSVSIGADEHDGWAEVRVADDGNGLADPRGSGLRGLVDRVEALGGRLVVDARPGRGTTVTARIPVAEAT